MVPVCTHIMLHYFVCGHTSEGMCVGSIVDTTPHTKSMGSAHKLSHELSIPMAAPVTVCMESSTCTVCMCVLLVRCMIRIPRNRITQVQLTPKLAFQKACVCRSLPGYNDWAGTLHHCAERPLLSVEWWGVT